MVSFHAILNQLLVSTPIYPNTYLSKLKQTKNYQRGSHLAQKSSCCLESCILDGNAAPLSIQLPAKDHPEWHRIPAYVFGCLPHMGDQIEFLAPDFSPGYCRHLWSEPMNGKVLCLSLCLFISVPLSFQMQIKLQLTKSHCYKNLTKLL